MKVVREKLAARVDHRKWYEILPMLMVTIFTLSIVWWLANQASPDSNGYKGIIKLSWVATIFCVGVMALEIFGGRMKCRYCGKSINNYQPAIYLEWDEESKYSAKIVKVDEVFHEKCHRDASDDKKFKMPPPFDDIRL